MAHLSPLVDRDRRPCLLIKSATAKVGYLVAQVASTWPRDNSGAGSLGFNPRNLGPFSKEHKQFVFYFNRRPIKFIGCLLYLGINSEFLPSLNSHPIVSPIAFFPLLVFIVIILLIYSAFLFARNLRFCFECFCCL